MSYEITLDKLLENRDAELYGRLLKIRKISKPLLSYTQGKFPYYTPHDFSHSESVEENLNWLVPDQLKDEMNKYELFFIMVAAWLHDWGMIGESDEDSEEIREAHHSRTEKYFETMYDKLYLSDHEARIIGRICKGHRKVDLNTPEYDDVVFGQNFKIRKRFLSALLRIADECDITHNRTPEVIYYSINPSEQSEIEFKKHLSIAGIGQLEEKHKIYISAIAKDPKGARTLREVAQKIQCELDIVKGILAQSGMMLDLVELRLETRGFIDKPISFEVDKTKIVKLLIGDHLYSHQDVAIRELIQNSIDSCKLRMSLESDFPCKIVLKRVGDNTITIEDNGLGMDYYEAKNFLSNIGSSFYKSQLFQEHFGENAYCPISQFGIGVLSSFLICNKATIETLKDGNEPCRFSVDSVNEEWKYEKGSLTNSGTKITLELNEEGKNIKIGDSLNRYFLCPEIPIEYVGQDGESRKFENIWAAAQIYERFIIDREERTDRQFKEILNETCLDYDFMVTTDSEWMTHQLVLFNHGIYVGKFVIDGMSNEFGIFVNLKKNLVDLHISRENVKKNEKWLTFIYLLCETIFQSLKKKFNNNNEKIISIISRMTEDRLLVEVDSEADLLEKIPFLKCFLSHAPFPVLTNGKIEFVKVSHALSGQDVSIYNCCSSSFSDELDVVSKLSDVTSLLINPYKLLGIKKRTEQFKTKNTLKYILDERKITYTEIDLLKMLISIANESDINYPELIPENIRFATFGKNIRPLVVIYKQPVVEKHDHALGEAYWGNILLWKKLLGKERLEGFLKSINAFHDDRYERLNIIEEPLVYIDSSDTFISSVLDKRANGEFDIEISRKVYRYLKYLSYLPLAIYDMSSCIIFLEVIDELEAEICACLKLAQLPPSFERIEPKLILQYYDKYGVGYIEQ